MKNVEQSNIKTSLTEAAKLRSNQRKRVTKKALTATPSFDDAVKAKVAEYNLLQFCATHDGLAQAHALNEQASAEFWRLDALVMGGARNTELADREFSKMVFDYSVMTRVMDILDDQFNDLYSRMEAAKLFKDLVAQSKPNDKDTSSFPALVAAINKRPKKKATARSKAKH